MRYSISLDGRRFDFRSYSADDAITRRMQKYGTFYERDLLDYSRGLLATLPPGGLVVDIGANLGNHAVYWGAYSGRTVVAVEANPALAPILTENLRANVEPDRFHVIAGGAGAEPGLARVKLAARAPDQFGLAGVAIADGLRLSDDGVFEIQPLEGWLRRLQRHDAPTRLLKIDVEGAEVNVLRGAAAILRRDRPEIIAEAASPAEQAALDEALRPYGYRRLFRFCSTPTWHFSTITDRRAVWRLAWLAAASRLRWRRLKLTHSLVSRLRRAG